MVAPSGGSTQNYMIRKIYLELDGRSFRRTHSPSFRKLLLQKDQEVSCFFRKAHSLASLRILSGMAGVEARSGRNTALQTQQESWRKRLSNPIFCTNPKSLAVFSPHSFSNFSSSISCSEDAQSIFLICS